MPGLWTYTSEPDAPLLAAGAQVPVGSFCISNARDSRGVLNRGWYRYTPAQLTGYVVVAARCTAGPATATAAAVRNPIAALTAAAPAPAPRVPTQTPTAAPGALSSPPPPSPPPSPPPPPQPPSPLPPQVLLPPPPLQVPLPPPPLSKTPVSPGGEPSGSGTAFFGSVVRMRSA